MKVWPFGFLALLVGLGPAAAVEKGTVDRGELYCAKTVRAATPSA